MKKKSKNNNKTIYEKAIRLVEGGYVEIDGLIVRAKAIDIEDDACYICEMDSICHSEFAAVCQLCDSFGTRKYLLDLVNKT